MSKDRKNNKPNKPGKMIAKKDFTIVQNDYKRVISPGDDLSDVPERFHQNLKTEKVI